MNERQLLLTEHWFFGPILRNKAIYFQVIAATVFINIFMLLSSLFVMTVYDNVIPNNATESLITLTVGILMVVVFELALKIMRGIFIDKAGSKIDEEISSNLFNRLSRNENVINRPTGVTASIVKEFETLREFLGSSTVVVFVDLPFTFLFLFVLYFIGGLVAAIPAIIVLSVFTLGLLVQPIIRKLSINASLDGQSKQGTLVEMLNGMETLKTLPGINLLYDRWMTNVNKQNDVSTKSKFWSQLTSNASQSGQQLSQIGIVFYGVFLILDGAMTMGALIACVILSGRTLAPLGQISNLLGRMNQAFAAYTNFNDLMKEEVKEITKTGQLRKDTIQGNIRLTNVSLTYPNKPEPVINNISIDIRANEKIAFVGKIGSGKTSILRLLAGLADSTQGAIKIDNSDIKHLHPDDIRKHVGVVMQQSVIFSGTLKENLLLGNPEATDEQILKASKIANVDKIASGLPNGYDTVLSEGGIELSGGQRQAICIARAFINDPKIIIMDEPSSAMDQESERQLLEDLKTKVKDKTFILITHRGTLLSAVDRVITIDSGSIVSDKPRTQVAAPKTKQNTSKRKIQIKRGGK